MVHHASVAAALLSLALLAACDKDGTGTNITISGTDSEGKPAAAQMDGTNGRVKLDVPGVKVDVPIPRIALDSDNFDIEGVKLYPGTTVSGINVMTHEEGGQDDVKITFDAPADAATVGAWFAGKMKAEGFTVVADGANLSGRTDDGDPFKLELTPGAKGHSAGVLNLKG